jgi:hypothetical protein
MGETLIFTGIACIIAAIVGGGLKAFNIDFPSLTSTKRQVILAGFGICLCIGGLVVNAKNNHKADSASNSDSATPLKTVSDPPIVYNDIDTTVDVTPKDIVVLKSISIKTGLIESDEKGDFVEILNDGLWEKVHKGSKLGLFLDPYHSDCRELIVAVKRVEITIPDNSSLSNYEKYALSTRKATLIITAKCKQ